jgi:hypothetical protein
MPPVRPPAQMPEDLQVVLEPMSPPSWTFPFGLPMPSPNIAGPTQELFANVNTLLRLLDTNYFLST